MRMPIRSGWRRKYSFSCVYSVAMADKHTYVRVGKRQVALSNLDKLLYTSPDITKAEVISYYYTMAPYILRHSRGRPVSTVRYPDGIQGESFYFKDIPKWAPDWVETIRRGREQPKNYLLLNEDASIVRLANLAALEIHQTSTREMDKPDYIVYDLDPPEGMDFAEVKGIGNLLKEHLVNHGYQPFVKLSGSKGIHIFTPVNPRYEPDECFDAARNLIRLFKHPHTTLEISKSRRKNRMLIDIYRNRPGQTIVIPYSLRGRTAAPVSMPVTWDELRTITSSSQIVMAQALEWVESRGDVWESFMAESTNLHTDTRSYAIRELEENRHRKTPDQLKEYLEKRDFGRTPEPNTDLETKDNSQFVIHRHDASHLHYDLRIASDGVLKSWALPKGLPARPGIKLLAIQTEDHPMDYLTFEGDIPRQEYGGGRMWIFKQGKYSFIKQKKDGFYIRLSARGFQAEYRMHNMKGKEWLLERVDNPVNDWLTSPPSPMLAIQRKRVPVGNYLYELKWDGIRAILVVEDNLMKIFSRSGREITEKFPEISSSPLRLTNGILDAEIICFDKEGKPDFRKVLSRLHRKRAHGKAYAYAFDLLYVDGMDIMNSPLWRRRAWLEECLGKQQDHIRFSREEKDGKELFEATKRLGLEGILAKGVEDIYRPGIRSETWIKVKGRTEALVFIIGYTSGENERAETFGALHVAEPVDDQWIYRGKVGNGFNEKKMKEIIHCLPQTVEHPDENILNLPRSTRNDTWVAPGQMAAVKYASLTGKGIYREPVFIKLIDHN